MRKFIIFITVVASIITTIIIAKSDLEEKQWDGIFGKEMIENFEKQWKDDSKEAGFDAEEKKAILSKVGKIAFYFRLYRAWTFTPAGKKGFIDRFPEPKISIHPEIVEHCEGKRVKGLKLCINAIYESIQKRSEFLFPSRDQHIEDFVINEESFQRFVGDSMFVFDVSVSYLMCFFTKNHLFFLKALPFCSYGFEEGQKRIWPSSIFRDSSNNPLLFEGLQYEPIDELDSRGDFVCADESFCPDPCCGRTTNRITTLCSHEICREQDIRRITLQQHFAFSSTNLSSSNFTFSASEGDEQHYCRVDDKNNNHFLGLSLNKWNVSCTCKEAGYSFRFDTLQCVDIDECEEDSNGKLCDAENEECINRIGSFSCECLPGYYRNQEVNGTCVELNLRKSNWFGAAHVPASSNQISFINYFSFFILLCCFV